MTLTQRDYLQMERPQATSTKRTALTNILYSFVASVIIFFVVCFFVYLLLELLLNVGIDDTDSERFFGTLLVWYNGGILIIPVLWILLSLWAGYLIFKSNIGTEVSRCPNCKNVLDDARNCKACDYRFSEHTRALYTHDLEKGKDQQQPESDPGSPEEY